MCLGGNDHLIAWADAVLQVSHVQGRHARADTDAVRAMTQKRCKFGLERPALWTMGQYVTIQYFHHRFPVVGGDPRPAKRDIASISHS